MAGNLSYTEIARKVFEKYGEKKPMHYKEIAEKAADEGWLSGDIEEHAEALRSAITNDIAENGRASAFATHGQEYLGLRKWVWHGFAAQIHDHNKIVRDMILKKLLAMDSRQFESCIQKLLEAMGFENLTSEIKENEIVFRGVLVAEDVIRIPLTVWAVNGEIQTNVLISAQKLSVDEYGLFITTSEKSASSVENSKISFIGPEKLISLLIDKELAV